jgi:hypothetical protein
MSKSAFTLKVFGIYLIIIGVALIFVPNILLSIFGLPQTTEVWIRIVGVMAINMGICFIFFAKHEVKPFFHFSVYMRLCVFIAFLVFVGIGLAKPVLILFAGVDLLGGIWTFITLKNEK